MASADIITWHNYVIPLHVLLCFIFTSIKGEEALVTHEFLQIYYFFE